MPNTAIAVPKARRQTGLGVRGDERAIENSRAKSEKRAITKPKAIKASAVRMYARYVRSLASVSVARTGSCMTHRALGESLSNHVYRTNRQRPRRSQPKPATISSRPRPWSSSCRAIGSTGPLARDRDPQADRFAARREALSKTYPGTYLVLPAGIERVRANDTSFRFRPSSDFAYLLGAGEPGAVLVLEPRGAGHRSVLFVPEHNRGTAEFFTDRVHGELWVGRHRGVDESKAYFGVDECRPMNALTEYLDELRDAKFPLRLLRGHDDDGRRASGSSCRSRCR